MKKMHKSHKNFFTGLLVGLVGMACVGVLGAVSNGYKDWNKDNFDRYFAFNNIWEK